MVGWTGLERDGECSRTAGAGDGGAGVGGVVAAVGVDGVPGRADAARSFQARLCNAQVWRHSRRLAAAREPQHPPPESSRHVGAR
jgi:hypothetical protein